MEFIQQFLSKTFSVISVETMDTNDRSSTYSWSQAVSLHFIIPTVCLEFMAFHLVTKRHRHRSLLNSTHLPKSQR